MMWRRLLGVVSAVVLLGGLSACSNMSAPESAESVEWSELYDPDRPTQYVYYEAEPDTVTVSQITPPKAGESDGSAVVYIPPLDTELGDSFTISSISTHRITTPNGGTTVVKLCAFTLSEERPRNENCKGVHYSKGADGKHNGSHVRVDGLMRGEHRLEIGYHDSSDLNFYDRRYVTFESPPLHR